MTDSSWQRTGLALAMLSVDPIGLGGAVIRMRSGPQRDAVLTAIDIPLPCRKIPVTISDDQLLGGLDLSATLAAGHSIETKPLFCEPLCATIAMAERCPPDLAAKLGQIIDKGQQACLICLDEGADSDETCPDALTERLAFHICPDGRAPDHWRPRLPTHLPPAAAITESQIETLVTLAASFGISSLRAPILAVAAAKAHARLHGRAQTINDDIEAAAALVYPHRATQLPTQDDDEIDQSTPSDATDNADPETGPQSDVEFPDEMLVEAVRALLPPDILSGLVPAGTLRTAKGTGSGSKRKSNRRGRPLPPRAGRLDGHNRIDLIATLRAAAPWQNMRSKKDGQHVAIRADDIRVRHYQNRSDRLLIFTVDASGSAAMARLGEAKGAVELLLADAYASRDHVALIAFRGQGAELLLPPTRSLVQTKRRLSALPGGGGTPLAAGLDEAGRLAHVSRGRGLTPTMVLLTDGRANIDLNGNPDRAIAQADAEKVAITLRQAGTGGLVIDTGRRPSQPLKALSGLLGGPYIALPRANAETLQTAVSAALSA